jgi:hypothetical protein
MEARAAGYDGAQFPMIGRIVAGTAVDWLLNKDLSDPKCGNVRV